MTFDEWWITTGSMAFMAFPVSAATAKVAARKVWDASRQVVPTLPVAADMHVRIAEGDHGGAVLQYAAPGWGNARDLGLYACFKIEEPAMRSEEELIAIISGVSKQLEAARP